MSEEWTAIDRRIRAQRVGMRMLLQASGVQTVLFRRRGEQISADLLGRDGSPCMNVHPEHAPALRHVAVSQLKMNARGAPWQDSAGTLEWLLDGDITLSYQHHPEAAHPHVLGPDLRHVGKEAGEEAGLAEGCEVVGDGRADAPRMYG